MRRLGNRWSRRCYEAALHALWELNDAGREPLLVHGWDHVPGSISRDHAWVEVGDDVIDLTVGSQPIPRADFYARGRVDEAKLTRYAVREAAGLLIQHNSCGPWPGGASWGYMRQLTAAAWATAPGAGAK